MVIVCWILLVFFGIFALTSLDKYFNSGISTAHGVMMFIAIFIVALCCGVLFGGINFEGWFK